MQLAEFEVVDLEAARRVGHRDAQLGVGEQRLEVAPERRLTAVDRHRENLAAGRRRRASDESDAAANRPRVREAELDLGRRFAVPTDSGRRTARRACRERSPRCELPRDLKLAARIARAEPAVGVSVRRVHDGTGDSRTDGIDGANARHRLRERRAREVGGARFGDRAPRALTRVVGHRFQRFRGRDDAGFDCARARRGRVPREPEPQRAGDADD
ncbi:MAG: hypothetical protein EPO68_06395 [Planctomycetota bacterium]|nr:MAG: hypothetical protein EPO68_06395 [Planctomycetota bacterium]